MAPALPVRIPALSTVSGRSETQPRVPFQDRTCSHVTPPTCQVHTSQANTPAAIAVSVLD